LNILFKKIKEKKKGNKNYNPKKSKNASIEINDENIEDYNEDCEEESRESVENRTKEKEIEQNNRILRKIPKNRKNHKNYNRADTVVSHFSFLKLFLIDIFIKNIFLSL